MATKHGYRVGKYELHCDPMPMADGRFGAQVVIYTNEVGKLVERRFPALDYFDTEAEAVAHARGWGERWIEDNG